MIDAATAEVGTWRRATAARARSAHERRSARSWREGAVSVHAGEPGPPLRYESHHQRLEVDQKSIGCRVVRSQCLPIKSGRVLGHHIKGAVVQHDIALNLLYARALHPAQQPPEPFAHQLGVTLHACGLEALHDDPDARFALVINASASSLAGGPPPIPAPVLAPGCSAVALLYGPAAPPFLHSACPCPWRG